MAKKDMKLDGKKISHVRFNIVSVLYWASNEVATRTVLLGKGKKKFSLPGGESNPGLPRDRRGYSPLY